MWSLALKAVLGFAGRYAQPLLIAALIGLVGLYAKGGYDNWKLKRAVAAAEQRADKALAAQRDAERRFDALVRDYNEQARAADERERLLLAERDRALAKVKGDYETRIGAVDRSLQLALDGLRHSADADRRRALKAAADAPAACRDHVCPATQLAVPDAEFLVGEAARADRVAVRLAACQQYVTSVCLRQGVSE